jgi:hypothetical protein
MHACGAQAPPSLRMLCCTTVPHWHWHSISMVLSCREAPCHHVLLRPAFSLPRNNNEGHTNSCSTADSFTPCCKKTPGIFAAQLQAPPPKLKVSLALPMPCQSPTQVTATAALPTAGSRIAVTCRRYGSSMSCKAKAPSPPPLQWLHCMLRSSGNPAKAEVELGQAAPTACRVPAAAAGVPAASTLLCG